GCERVSEDDGEAEREEPLCIDPQDLNEDERCEVTCASLTTEPLEQMKLQRQKNERDDDRTHEQKLAREDDGREKKNDERPSRALAVAARQREGKKQRPRRDEHTL